MTSIHCAACKLADEEIELLKRRIDRQNKHINEQTNALSSLQMQHDQLKAKMTERSNLILRAHSKTSVANKELNGVVDTLQIENRRLKSQLLDMESRLRQLVARSSAERLDSVRRSEAATEKWLAEVVVGNHRVEQLQQEERSLKLLSDVQMPDVASDSTPKLPVEQEEGGQSPRDFVGQDCVDSGEQAPAHQDGEESNDDDDAQSQDSSRSRRSVRSIVYKEPSLRSKLRKGDVFFAERSAENLRENQAAGSSGQQGEDNTVTSGTQETSESKKKPSVFRVGRPSSSSSAAQAGAQRRIVRRKSRDNDTEQSRKGRAKSLGATLRLH